MSPNVRLPFLASLTMLLAFAIALVSPIPPAIPRESHATRGPSTVDDQLHRRIDEWIARNGLNSYGDPPDTMYPGGTPLFDERTGVVKDRYQYILDRHPELKSEERRGGKEWRSR